MNSRPLTEKSDNINDLNVLTPNHFILGKQSLHFSPDTIKDVHETSRTRWKAVQALTKTFRGRFIQEYLPTLQIRKKWNKVQCNLKQNDLVLFQKHSIPRSYEPLARVTETYPGKEGGVRSAKFKLPNSVVTRPCNKLSY